MSKGYTHARPDQWIEIDAFLKGNLEIIEPKENGKKGKVRYLNNLSDKDIAEAVGVAPSSVAHLRQLKYGNLQEARKASNSANEKLNDIEAHISSIEKECRELRSMINGLNGELRQLKQLHDNVAKLAGEARATSYGNFDDLKKVVGRLEKVEETSTENQHALSTLATRIPWLGKTDAS